MDAGHCVCMSASSEDVTLLIVHASGTKRSSDVLTCLKKWMDDWYQWPEQSPCAADEPAFITYLVCSCHIHARIGEWEGSTNFRPAHVPIEAHTYHHCHCCTIQLLKASLRIVPSHPFTLPLFPPSLLPFLHRRQCPPRKSTLSKPSDKCPKRG